MCSPIKCTEGKKLVSFTQILLLVEFNHSLFISMLLNAKCQESYVVYVRWIRVTFAIILIRSITIEKCNCLIFVYTHLMTILSHLSRELTKTLSHSAFIQGLVAVALAVGRGCGRRWQQHRVSLHLHKKGQGSFVWSTGPLLLLCLCFNTPFITQLYTPIHTYVYCHCLITLSTFIFNIGLCGL